jgi:hypothetical protein
MFSLETFRPISGACSLLVHSAFFVSSHIILLLLLPGIRIALLHGTANKSYKVLHYPTITTAPV